MTKLLTTLGLLVLVCVVAPLGSWLCIVAIAGERPFHDQRALTPAAGTGVSLAANDVAVTVVASPDTAVHVTTSGTYSLSGPSISIATTTTTGIAPAPPTAGTSLGPAAIAVDGCWRCRLTVTLAVPPRTPTTVTGGTPTGVTALGVSAPLQLETGSGTLLVRDFQGATLAARTGDGDINIDLGQPTSAIADTGTGDITITAPATGRYALDPQTGSGTVTATLSDDPTSPSRITAHTGSGNVALSPP